MAQNMLHVMRALSYFDAGFEPQCPRKEFLIACLLLLLLLLLLAVAAVAAKMCCSPWTLRRVVTPRQGKLSSVTLKLQVTCDISLGHPFYANTERFHIFSDFSQLLA